MIISKQDGKLVLIRQEDHAQQVGDIARKYGNETFKQLLKHESVSLAIEQHDSGWHEPDAEVLFNSNTKRPLNFMDIQLPDHVQFYELGYRNTLEKDPYAGMMLGMHWLGLYTSRFGYDPTFTYHVPDHLENFMNQTLSSIQKEWIDIKSQYWTYQQKFSEFEDQVWMSYEFFQVMDRLGLFMGLNNPAEEKVLALGVIRPTRTSEPVEVTAKSTGNGIVELSPFPFAQGFETTVPARRIEDRDYENQQEAKSVLESTEMEDVTWKIVAR